ncbi:unnamed protein product [Clonostachys rosea]|uniref:WW domain-containing protein n=1 Tax=Bionectria ochroleuca TaxID=29856 RepID=A0ABY6UQB7_BIOOC|nr:unnamed protein product [Clonostachys rosea]
MQNIPPNNVNWAPPPGMPPLPAGWIAEWDNNYNAWYFANIESGTSQWQFPGTTPVLSHHESPNPSQYDQDAELAARLQAEENSHTPSGNHSHHQSQNYSLESDAALALRLQNESENSDAALAARLQNQSLESDAALAASLQNGTYESDAALAARLQNGTMESDAALAARLQNGTVDSDAAMAARLQAEEDARNSSRPSGRHGRPESRPEHYGYYSPNDEIPPELPTRPQSGGNMFDKLTNKLNSHASANGQPNKYAAPSGPPPKKASFGAISGMVKDRLKNKNKEGRHD